MAPYYEKNGESDPFGGGCANGAHDCRQTCHAEHWNGTGRATSEIDVEDHHLPSIPGVAHAIDLPVHPTVARPLAQATQVEATLVVGEAEVSSSGASPLVGQEAIGWLALGLVYDQ